jgi:hypothetical protein
MTYLRHAPQLLSIFAALTVLCACPGTEGDDDATTDESDTGDTGGELACIDPGSELLPNVKPARVPFPGSSNFTCTAGWGTDAPQRDSLWTIQVGQVNIDFSFAPVRLGAHPDGGVVVAAGDVFARYDADGDEMWSVAQVANVQGQVVLVVEQAGTIVLGTYDWNTEIVKVIRYTAAGDEVGAVSIPWNSMYPNIWGLETFGDDLLVGGFDEDANGSYEQTLFRIDAAGELLLRKSTGLANGPVLAVNDSGTAMFGSTPGFLLSLDNGAVTGNLTPSVGFVSAVTGSGEDFYMTGNATGDMSVGRYSSGGTERWLQTYDRATLGDQGRAIAVAGDKLVIVGMTNLLDSSDSWWFGTQPVVIAVDTDGAALWSDRISAYSDVSAVAIGSGGEVYVAGTAEGMGPANQQPPLMQWVRRYDL